VSSKAKLDLTYLGPVGSSSKKETSEDGNDEKDGRREEEEKDSGGGGTKKKEKKQETAFDQLVLPDGHKEMVLALIAQHFRDKESATADKEQVDIVRGKGKKHRHGFESNPLCEQ
jgi:hypothetical protein